MTLPISDQYQSSSEIYKSGTTKACTETQANWHIKSAYWAIFHAFLSFAENFSKSSFWKNSFKNTIRVCQTVWIQIRPNILSGLICVQTVCKSYQQTTLGDKELINPCLVNKHATSKDSRFKVVTADVQVNMSLSWLQIATSFLDIRSKYNVCR